MVRERLLRAKRTFEVPRVRGRELSLRIQEGYRGPLHSRRRQSLDGGPPSEEMAASVRNRVIIQEIKNVYNRMSGVGDVLVEARLPLVLPADRRASGLTRSDLETLNRELAELAADIFGAPFARHAEAHIRSLIQQVLD